MVIRKRKQPTPDFKQPPPFQPITGGRAQLRMFGFFPYCAMVQVAEEDTHDNYVLCRGFDIRIPKFVDYDAADLANKPGIPVAKPYNFRMPGVYQLAHVYAAFLPLQTSHPSPIDVPWRVGQNPGVAKTCQGQPCDLDETIEELLTSDELKINWMLLDPPELLRGGCLDENHTGRGAVFHIHLGTWDPAIDGWDYDLTKTVHAIDWRYDVPYPDAGATGLFWPRISTTNGVIWEVVSLDCSSPGPCA